MTTLAARMLATAWGLGCGDVVTQPIVANALMAADAQSSTVGDTSTLDDTSTIADTSADADTSTGPPTSGQLLALLQAHPCTSANMVSQHLYARWGSAVPDIPVCSLNGAIYYYSSMSIACDGRAGGGCPGAAPNYIPFTAYYNTKNMSLAAGVTPYVVLPRDLHYAGLDTTQGGNVTAVIYKGQLAYAVFGDTGPIDGIGSASYACAESVGVDPDPATGGVTRGVTYIVFVGAGTAPADIEDQAATNSLGEQLAAALIANN